MFRGVSDTLTRAALPGPDQQYPNRAAWLQSKLDERKWDKNTLEQFHGPEHRTTQKILEGKSVGGGPLRKLIAGLNGHTRAIRVKFQDIPND